MKYVVLYSGGHSSAICAVEAVRKYGKESVILLNHDISSNVECADTKRFKSEVADYLGIEITYANMDNFEEMDPIAASVKRGGWKFYNQPAVCTYLLKTKPFNRWLRENYPVTKGEVRDDVVFLYGFDKGEEVRMERRTKIMLDMGYKTEYPIVNWEKNNMEYIRDRH